MARYPQRHDQRPTLEATSAAPRAPVRWCEPHEVEAEDERSRSRNSGVAAAVASGTGTDAVLADQRPGSG